MYPYDNERENAETESALNRMVEDRLYWQERDPEFRRYVDDSFKSAYGNDAAEQDATGRTVAPARRAVALPPFRPSVAPDDTALSGPVGDAEPNAWRDVLKVQKGLARTKHYAFDFAKERSGEHSPALAQAIRDFQRERKEEIDGLILPGGPTITRIKESLFGDNAGHSAGPTANSFEGLATMLTRRLPDTSQRRTPDQLPLGDDDNAQFVQVQDAGQWPRQVSPQLPPPDGIGSRPTHREAEDRSIERMVPYPIVELPNRLRFQNAPRLQKGAERQSSILNDSPGRITVAENPTADRRAPANASHIFGWVPVSIHDAIIEREAARFGVDSDLVRAIMYVENAQGGHYGAVTEAVGIARSILPINIRYDTWSGLGFSRDDFNDAALNIRAGVMLIRRIHDRLERPTVAKIATLYNSMAKDAITDYGARVAQVYQDRRWQRLNLAVPP